WMKAMQNHSGLLDGVLAVAHPALYRAGVEVRRKLSMQASELRQYLTMWPSVFNAVQVIINRMTIHHRDVSGRPGWMDMLLSMGTYGERGVMSFRNLSVSVPYDTGSVVLVNSKVVIHSVPQVPPDRICYAFFMLDFVHSWVGQEDSGWSKITDRRRVP
ncbi:hypothetical protein L226DRAFT_472340, partial [Lentinus tigrinus ALCF2SS1-7]|uniref:uncharacterized protein n=1 Tax=Lentinus tigrinus ALCF2SS1-7 TaxID=1328758 RepID=UPI001165E8CB